MQFLTKIKAKWMWRQLKKLGNSKVSIGRRESIKRDLLRDVGILRIILDDLLSETNVLKKVKDLDQFRFVMIVTATYASHHSEKLDLAAIEKALKPFHDFADLIDWVLMFESTYQIPFHAWQDIAPQSIEFLEQQWRQGPVSFPEFYDGNYEIKTVLQERKDLLRNDPEYERLLLRNEEI